MSLFSSIVSPVREPSAKILIPFSSSVLFTRAFTSSVTACGLMKTKAELKVGSSEATADMLWDLWRGPT